MKRKHNRAIITLKNGKELDYITSVGIYEKLTALIAELGEPNLFNAAKPSSSKTDTTPKMFALKQCHITRSKHILRLFELLNECQSSQQLTVD